MIAIRSLGGGGEGVDGGFRGFIWAPYGPKGPL